jgi:hypothetical protein
MDSLRRYFQPDAAAELSLSCHALVISWMARKRAGSLAAQGGVRVVSD